MMAGRRRYQIYLKNNDGNAIYAFLLTNEKMSEGPADEMSRQLFGSAPSGLLAPGPDQEPCYGVPALAPFEGVLDAFGDDFK
jgi:hypothetical protein